jgi:osmotically-inducible protein OsmY
MRTDAEVEADVMSELAWESDLDARRITVAVRDGVVTLTGHVDSLQQRWIAESAAKRVLGVRAVANALEVPLPATSERTDAEILEAIRRALHYELGDKAEAIRVLVSAGHVRLEGEVEKYPDRQCAGRVARQVLGAKSLTNAVSVRKAPVADDVQRRIANALTRSAIVDAAGVEVTVEGSKATLSGWVRSWAEMRAAEEAAWRAPCVTEVENRIAIRI